MIYLDHPATSWPKPPEVLSAMRDFLEQAGGNPGRSGHRLSLAAGRTVYETREALAEFFHAPRADHVIFTQNATHALNLALRGMLKPGDAVVTTGMEHNSVMRPLRALERQGVTVRIVPCDTRGSLDMCTYRAMLAENPRMVVLTHSSNVIGQVTPVQELAKSARQAGALVLVDAAQSAGVIPIDVAAMGIDLLAFTGHKGLQGPPGTGGLVIGMGVDPVRIEPLMCGGTGSRSQFEEQPEMLPDRLESGTPNGPGIAGLGAAVKWIADRGIGAIREHHDRLMRLLISGFAAIPGCTAYGPPVGEERAPLVSFTIEGLSVSEIGMRLDEEFGILCRVGLHCAPAAHKTLGTFPHGTVRFGIGPMTTEEEIETALDAVRRIAER